MGSAVMQLKLLLLLSCGAVAHFNTLQAPTNKQRKLEL